MTAAVERLSRAASSLLGKTYELSLTKNYVSRWGMVHAVRELIQNALDSDSPFVYEFSDEGDDRFSLRLTSEFTILTPQTLLLGATSKADSEDSIGSFGEGYKIALLVLTRLGYDVEIQNGDLLWKPRFRFSRTFGEEILVVDEIVSPERGNRGMTFVVRGLGEGDVSKIREICLRMQDSIGAIKSTEFGEILLEKPGKLYVGALFVCETEMRYGYNIKPKYLRLERDRQTVFDWDLKALTVKMWFETGEVERVARMIFEQYPDVEDAKYDAPEIVKEECYRVFRANNPEAIIASSPEEMRQKINAGMTRTVYVGSTVYGVISSSRSYRSELPRLVVELETPKQKLARFLSAHRDEMRRPAIVAFKALIEEAGKWKRA